MSYRVELEDRAARELVRLPKAVVKRIREAVLARANDPRPPGAKKLTAREGHRTRVGDYRILYEVQDDVRRIRIYRIGHRKNVYQ